MKDNEYLIIEEYFKETKSLLEYLIENSITYIYFLDLIKKYYNRLKKEQLDNVKKELMIVRKYLVDIIKDLVNDIYCNKLDLKTLYIKTNDGLFINDIQSLLLSIEKKGYITYEFLNKISEYKSKIKVSLL